MIALFFASCQDESVEIINPNEQEAIVPNSSLSNLMLRTSANAVSNDNVLDNSDCFSVELPVTVVVGNITIVSLGCVINFNKSIVDISFALQYASKVVHFTCPALVHRCCA